MGGVAARATCVTLAHSTAAKNSPSDATVTQQPRVTGAFAEPTEHVDVWTAVRIRPGRVALKRRRTGARPGLNCRCFLQFCTAKLQHVKLLLATLKRAAGGSCGGQKR